MKESPPEMGKGDNERKHAFEKACKKKYTCPMVFPEKLRAGAVPAGAGTGRSVCGAGRGNLYRSACVSDREVFFALPVPLPYRAVLPRLWRHQGDLCTVSRADCRRLFLLSGGSVFCGAVSYFYGHADAGVGYGGTDPGAALQQSVSLCGTDSAAGKLGGEKRGGSYFSCAIDGVNRQGSHSAETRVWIK